MLHVRRTAFINTHRDTRHTRHTQTNIHTHTNTEIDGSCITHRQYRYGLKRPAQVLIFITSNKICMKRTWFPVKQTTISLCNKLNVPFRQIQRSSHDIPAKVCTSQYTGLLVKRYLFIYLLTEQERKPFCIAELLELSNNRAKV